MKLNVLDIEAPVFDTCPSVVIKGTERGRTKGKLVWQMPTVTDNSGKSIKPKLSMNSPAMGSDQSAGMYTISYSAEDQDGNRARNCEFKVIVRGNNWFSSRKPN